MLWLLPNDVLLTVLFNVLQDDFLLADILENGVSVEISEERIFVENLRGVNSCCV